MVSDIKRLKFSGIGGRYNQCKTRAAGPLRQLLLPLSCASDDTTVLIFVKKESCFQSNIQSLEKPT